MGHETCTTDSLIPAGPQVVTLRFLVQGRALLPGLPGGSWCPDLLMLDRVGLTGFQSNLEQVSVTRSLRCDSPDVKILIMAVLWQGWSIVSSVNLTCIKCV